MDKAPGNPQSGEIIKLDRSWGAPQLEQNQARLLKPRTRWTLRLRHGCRKRLSSAHTVNDSPHPHERLTLGLTSLKPADISSSP